MTSAVTSAVDQLKEIFPNAAEVFLKAVCSAYNEDELEIDKLIEDVLSYETIPEEVPFNSSRLSAVDIDDNSFRSMTEDDEVSIAIERSFECVVNESGQLNEDSCSSGDVEIRENEIPTIVITDEDSSDNTRKDAVDSGEHEQKNGQAITVKDTSVETTEETDFENESLIECEESFDEDVTVGGNINLKPTNEKQASGGIVSAGNNAEEKPLNHLNRMLTTDTDINELHTSSVLDSDISCETIDVSAETSVSFCDDLTTDNPNTVELPQTDSTEIADKEVSDVLKEESCSKNNFQSQPSTSSNSEENYESAHSSDGRSSKRSLYCSSSLSIKLNDPNKSCVKKPRKSITPDSQSLFDDVDSKFDLLCKIFSDADREFLYKKCLKLSSHQELLVFISQTLDNQDYPRASSTVSEQEEYFMEKFQCSIEEFLEEIPDPIAEFSSKYYTRAGYEGNAELYLHARYNWLGEEVIKEKLKKNNYNLTKICEQLETEGVAPGPYSLEDIQLHHPPSVFFHQEVWFIEHRREIQNMLDSVLEAARLEEELNKPPPPPEPEELFECGICSEEVLEYIELGTCDGPGGHLFCKTCIKRNTEIKIGEGATTFPCLANCGGFIPIQTIEEVLPPQTFGILMSKIQEAEVKSANIAGIETCPFCPYAYGPGPEGVFCCLNPVCMKKSCRTCRKVDHTPSICNMFQEEDEETARHFIENKMTEALIRECPKCAKPIVKIEGGCNKMTCVCGTIMCYLCRKPNVDYSHFNGQGGTEYTKCELFSQETTVHDQPVKVSAEQALNAILQNNPALNLDRNKIMPK